ncbi:MAG TPA: hypothetical protein VKZ75_01995 [Cyclobacteriaceae bacterium]|nr:hypothetical protein [Cyclobacteriaceae bacterium]
MKYALAIILLLTGQLARAQEQVEMADAMRANGKIYVIVGIVVIILAGMVAYLFLLDRKITRLENEVESKTK